MNLQEKVEAINNDVIQAKNGIDSLGYKYSFPITVIARGTKSGLSVTVDRDFDKAAELAFKRRTASQS